MTSRRKRSPSLNADKPLNRRLEGPTAVYRLFDKDGRLLYVGVSHDPISRWKQHEGTKLWWHWVADKQVVWRPSRLAAFQLEAEIEHAEEPLFCRVPWMGNGSLSRGPERNEDLDRELASLTVELRRQIEAGRYPLRGQPRPVGPHAALYRTSNVLFFSALYRAQCEIQGRGEAP